MTKPGEKFVCGTCGVEVVCIEGCGCRVPHLVCCGKLMKKRAHKRPKKVKKTAKKKKK
jgi:hypothetical protein